MNDRYVSLIRNTGIVFLGNVGSKLLVFLMLPFYTHFLSPEQYGIADLIITYGMLLLGVVTCQIQDAVFVLPKGRSFEVQRAFFSSGLTFLFVAYTAGAIISMLAVMLLPKGCFIHQYGVLIFLYLLGLGVQNFLQQFCRGVGKMVLYAVIGLVFTVATVCAALIWIPFDPTGRVMIYTQLIGFFTAGCVAVFVGRLWIYWCAVRRIMYYLKLLLGYSFPLIPTAIMWWALSSMNRPFLVHYCGLDAVGMYSAAVKIPAVLSLIWSVVGNAWQISVLEEFKSRDFLSYYCRFFILMAVCLSVAALILSVMAPWYMRLIVSPDFYLAWKLIPVLSVGAVFSILGGVIGALFSASHKSVYFLWSSIWAILIVGICNLVLIPIWGVQGAAIANACGLVAEFVVRWIYGKRILRTMKVN